jgi:hypothetical protein
LSALLDVITIGVSFVIGMLAYPPFIAFLRRRRAGQVIQSELPAEHQLKAGTPTGGGILFVALTILAGLLATAAGHPLAPQLLRDALQIMDTHLWSHTDAMVVDTYDQRFTDLSPYRGVNANMHTVEAFLAASDVTGDPQWRDRALQICDRGYVLDQGRNAYTASGKDLINDPKVVQLYLGTLAKA